MTRRGAVVRFGILVTLGAVLLGVRLWSPERVLLEEAVAWIETLESWGPLAYVAVYAAASLALFPGALLALAGGSLFGWKLGLLAVVLGSNLAANLGFLASRLLGRGLIERVPPGRLPSPDRILARSGLELVLLLRLAMVVPLLNYGLGLSPLRWRDYALGSAVGMFPSALAFVSLGANLSLRSPWFWLSLLLVLGACGLAAWVRKRRAPRASPAGDRAAS